jgi:hypothetical protein
VEKSATITNRTRDYVSCGIILAAILIYFYKVFFTGNNFFIGDIYTQFFPWKNLLKNAITEGSVPFWTPFVFSGMPFAADIQKGVFYPPGIIFYFLNFSTAFKLYFLLHYIIMGFSIYYFLRSLNFKSAPSLAGSFVFLFNSFSVTRVDFLSALGSYALFPMIMLAFNRFLLRRKILDWVMFIIILTLSFLSGHPPVFIYTVIFAFFFWIYHIWKTREFSLMPIPLLKASAYILGGTIMLLLLSMPQSGLFIDFIRNTSRAYLSYTEASADSMAYSGLLSFLMPGGIAGLEINPLSQWLQFSTGSMNYFSVTFVFLFFLSFFYPKNKLYVFSVISIAAGILLSLGSNTPLHSWFYAFAPFFWSLRHPGFAIMLITIPAAVITAFSIENIRLLTPIQLSLFENMSPFSGMRNYFDARFTNKIFSVFLVFLALFMLILLNSESVLKIYGLNAAAFINFIYGCLFFLGLFFLNVILFFFCEKNSISKNFYFIILGLMIFAELQFFISPVNPVITSKIYDLKKSAPETAELIKASNYKFLHTTRAAKERNFSGSSILSAQLNFLSSMPSNTGSLHGIYDAGGYNPLMLDNYFRFISPIFNGDEVVSPERLSLLNVKYLISKTDTFPAGYEKIYDNGLIKISKSNKTVPIFFVSKSSEKLDLRMAQSSWSRKKENDYNSIKINVKTDGDGYFVYSNNFYPGWKVYVDNQTGTLEKCFDLYMGVKITKGTHDITLVYTPEHLKDFLTMSYFTFSLICFMGLILVFRRRHETV